MADPTRVYLEGADGWQELHGIRDVRVEPAGDPTEWVLEEHGLGELRGFFAAVAEFSSAIVPVELALIILRPQLARCPLYVG